MKRPVLPKSVWHEHPTSPVRHPGLAEKPVTLEPLFSSQGAASMCRITNLTHKRSTLMDADDLLGYSETSRYCCNLGIKSDPCSCGKTGHFHWEKDLHPSLACQGHIYPSSYAPFHALSSCCFLHSLSLNISTIYVVQVSCLLFASPSRCLPQRESPSYEWPRARLAAKILLTTCIQR